MCVGNTSERNDGKKGLIVQRVTLISASDHCTSVWNEFYCYTLTKKEETKLGNDWLDKKKKPEADHTTSLESDFTSESVVLSLKIQMC